MIYFGPIGDLMGQMAMTICGVVVSIFKLVPL